MIPIAVGVGTAVLLYPLFFRDSGDFLDCLRYWLQPDVVSILRGEWLDDRWGSTKLFVWLGLAIGATLWAQHFFFSN